MSATLFLALKAIEADDCLGFCDARRALAAVLAHEDWLSRWDLQPETVRAVLELKAVRS